MPFSSSFIEQTIKIDSKTTLEKKNINLANNDYAFLSSFPRSGNGWVRLIFASLILEINGIDINSIKIIRKKTSGGVGYICLKSKQNNFDLEDIFP
ncbi:MAG: hypothetical protein QNJ60_12575, partial [Xenococcaceae cyanobacterium MO_188.B19]|nr:hypothetical protein [Xenococcaceae cyanobacterium MO_188.B19]